MDIYQDIDITYQKIDKAPDIPAEFLLSTYSYDLPPELIAQAPLKDRDESKLLLIDRGAGDIRHLKFFQLPDILNPGDVLVINETQVLPASLKGRKVSGGTVKLLVVDPASVARPPTDSLGPARRVCIFRSSGKLRDGSVIEIQKGIKLIFEKHIAPGKGLIRFPVTEIDFPDFLNNFGSPPLPPYIHRNPDTNDDDGERYQTIYAKFPGSIAAPTAGLHFTKRTIQALGDRGITIQKITLHVGPGTFVPIRTEDIRLHKMDPEIYCISDITADYLQECMRSQRRIIAVGSTCLRALEASYNPGKGFLKGVQATDLFIYPGYEFKVVKGIVTNFHLPESTLLTLVCAFAGTENILSAYRAAILNNYRFYSYGDACLII